MDNAMKIQPAPNIYKALLNELLKCSSHAVVLLNEDAEIIFSSESLESITGYSIDELKGKTAFDFFHPDDLTAAREQHNYLTGLNENTATSVIQIRNKKGEMIWIDVVVKNLLHVPAISALFVLLKKSSDVGTEERKLLKAVTDAKEQERQFLASELHDNINQMIGATKLLVDTARRRANKEELLQLSSAHLQMVTDEIRKLSYSMVSYDLQEFGLKFAVNAFITMMSMGCAVKFHVTMEEEALTFLTVDQQLQVYRIIQEGTNNIIRHAKATDAEITISSLEDLIYLVIKDNGKGFSVTKLKPGIGLSNITNRIKLLRGHFHVRAPKDIGTTIEIHFPVQGI
jgi:PAS domain S-box